MNKKQLLIALGVFVAVSIVGTALVLFERSAWKSTTSEKGRKVIDAACDVNKIENIKIKTAAASMTIQKKDDFWTLPENNNYPADFNMIREMIDNVWNMKITQKTKLNKDNLAKLDLLDPAKGQNSGTLIEFCDKDNKKIVAMILGKQHFAKPPQEMPVPMMNNAPDGRYVVMADKPETVYLIAEPFDIIQPALPLWRSKENLKIENISSIAYTSPKAANNWKIAKKSETENFIVDGLKKSEVSDDAQIQLFIQNLTTLGIIDVLPYSKLSETGLDSQDSNLLNISSTDNFNYAIKIAQKNGKYFMKYDVAYSPASEVDKQFSSAAEQDAKKTAADVGENKEDPSKAKADNEKRLRAKFGREKMLSQWIYVIPEKSAVTLLKARNDFLKKAAAAPAGKADKKQSSAAPAKKAAPKKTQKNQ